MSLTLPLLIGVGLAMDAVAASICSGTAARTVTWVQALKMAGLFGLFQALMPAIGYAGGVTFRTWLSPVDHWVALGILGFVGGKMIVESFREDGDGDGKDPFGMAKLILLSVATSLDALAVGLTFSLLDVSIAVAAFVIGAVTFVLCLPSVWLGGRLGLVAARRAELAGGVILIGIGLKIVVEHLSTGA
jgi:putative Mn2+ efflux pump MntP